MTVRVGINGLGRIGRGFLRVARTRKSELDIAAVNDPADSHLLAYLLQYDTAHGILPEPVEATRHSLRIGDQLISAYTEPDPAAVPWGDLGADIIIEASGRFASRASASRHLASGAKKVIIASVAKDTDATIIIGVNDHRLDPSRHQIISNSLCTAHCAAIMLKALHKEFGLSSASLTTLHAYTNRQALLDNLRENTRLSRSGTVNIIPSPTPVAMSVALTLPELEGRVDGLAMRIPVHGGSLVDLVAHLDVEVTASEVNAAFKAGANGPLRPVLDYTEDPVVSSDIIGSAASCTFDAGLTIAQQDYVKVVGWYDNEWGYCNRLADLAILAFSQVS
jgi:glyceraldehyde 3-phosphate dehydrogenase